VVKKALADGAHAYLRKGGPMDELVQAVEKATGRRGMPDALQSPVVDAARRSVDCLTTIP